MRPLLELFNTYDHPEIEDGVFVVQGRHGELFVTVRPVEAWQRWAETNGFTVSADFMDEFEDQIEWSDNGRRGFLDEGGSITWVQIEGYYRDGKKHL